MEETIELAHLGREIDFCRMELFSQHRLQIFDTLKWQQRNIAIPSKIMQGWVRQSSSSGLVHAP